MTCELGLISEHSSLREAETGSPSPGHRDLIAAVLEKEEDPLRTDQLAVIVQEELAEKAFEGMPRSFVVLGSRGRRGSGNC